MAETRRVRFRVAGRVQGVGFRAAAVAAAQRLGVTGFVRNAPDGAVEGEAEGGTEQVAAFADWLRAGPRWARVDTLDVTDLPATGVDREFTVRR